MALLASEHESDLCFLRITGSRTLQAARPDRFRLAGVQ